MSQWNEKSFILLFTGVSYLPIKQIDSVLPWVCSVMDYRWRQNVVKTEKWQTSRWPMCHLCAFLLANATVLLCKVTTKRKELKRTGETFWLLFLLSLSSRVNVFFTFLFSKKRKVAREDWVRVRSLPDLKVISKYYLKRKVVKMPPLRTWVLRRWVGQQGTGSSVVEFLRRG